MLEQSEGAGGAVVHLRTGDLARLTGVGKATIEHDLRLDLLRPVAVGS